MVKIEETHPYGRLVDLDVLWGNEELKSLHRGDLGLPPRRCFICQKWRKSVDEIDVTVLKQCKKNNRNNFDTKGAAK